MVRLACGAACMRGCSHAVPRACAAAHAHSCSAHAAAYTRCWTRTLPRACAAARARCCSPAGLHVCGAGRGDGAALPACWLVNPDSRDVHLRGWFGQLPWLQALPANHARTSGVPTVRTERRAGRRGGEVRHMTAPRQGIPSAAPQRLWREGD